MDSSGGHSQEMSSDSLGNMLGQKLGGQAQQSGDRKTRPQPEQALKCPRCDSTNTKFCYYNNYSLTQPRYFCKACRRYWTKGGTLRNVPVGGGCRKNRRSSATSSSSSSPAQPKRIDHHHHQNHHLINPLLHHQSYVNALQISGPGPAFGLQSCNNNLPGLGGYDQNDLSLAFARLQQQQQQQQQQNNNNNNHHLSLGGNDSTILGAGNNSAGFLDALRSGFLDHQGQSGSAFYDQSGGFEDHHHDDDHQVMTSTASVSVATVKQEACNNNNNNNKMLWGYNGPDHHHHHHLHQNGIGNLADFEGSAATNGGARESWNGFASSWHGLLNTTPLM